MEAIVSEMGKKSTFISAANKLAALVSSSWAGGSDKDREGMFAACKRAFSLLRSRYSAVGFWRAGRGLAEACVEAMKEDAVRGKAAREWLSLAEAEVGDGDKKSGVDAPPQPAPPPPNNPPGGEGPGAGGGGQAFESMLDSMVREMNIEELLAMVALDGGGLAGLGGGGGGFEDAKPAASREARFNLDMKTIKEKGLCCLICMDDFPPKSKAKVMPCGHAFHYDCLMEWLEGHNTCPTCRHELPREKPTFDIESGVVASRDPTASSLYI